MLNIKEEYDKCWHCESFYGPCFGEPLCVTCHLFLYANTNTIEDIDATSTTTTTTTAATTTSASCSASTGTTSSGTASSNDSNAAACGTSSSSSNTNASSSSSSSLRSVNQVQNMIQKLELNDSGNEDIDSDQLNQEATNTTVATNEESRNEFNDDDEEDDDDDDEDDDNDRNNNRSSNSSSNVFDDDERRQQQQQEQPAQQQRTSPRKRRRRSPVGAAAAAGSYYAMQYSRKQLNSLIRNGRINNNNNNNINNVNNNRQQLVPPGRQRQQQQQANLNSLSNNNNNNTVSRIFSSSCSKRRNDPLGEQIALLTSFNSSCPAQQRQPTSDLINILPTEVLWNIFKKLDDLSLWSASRVCKRWHELVSQEVSEDAWRAFIGARWVFFRSAVRVKSYRTLYSQLVQSSNCFYCLQHIHNRPDSQCSDELKKSWRHKRLLLELKALHQDPMSGINARPLDASCYYWQASITGPVGSPYEGGVFYLFLKIPQSYPLNPPLVRFITRIYHPNISKHGDIGLDSIHENWSLALTISKVLISIQSLLTDPYTRVCMEHDIGRLYTSNRDVYERNARYYTWKYAMSDYVQFDAYNNNINTYDNQFLLLNNQLTTGFENNEDEENDELTCNNYHNDNNNDRNSGGGDGVVVMESNLV